MSNILSGLFFLVVSALVGYGALTMSVGSFRLPGPGLYPLLLAFTLGGLSILLSLIGLKEARVEKHQPIASPHARNVCLVVGTLFAYTGLLPLLGYSIASFCVLVALFKIGAPAKTWWGVCVSAAVLTVCTEVLAFVLEIPLPRAYVRDLLPIVTGG